MVDLLRGAGPQTVTCLIAPDTRVLCGSHHALGAFISAHWTSTDAQYLLDDCPFDANTTANVPACASLGCIDVAGLTRGCGAAVYGTFFRLTQSAD